LPNKKNEPIQMRFYIRYLLVFLFSFQFLYRNGVIMMYAHFQEDIASNFCENRLNKNKKNCKGKCYLNKQFESSPTKEASSFSLSDLKSDLFLQIFPSYDFSFKTNTTKILEIYELIESLGVSKLITPPPQNYL